MSNVQSKLLSYAGTDMELYAKVVNELCRFLVTDIENTRKINDDGVFELAHGLKLYSIQTARIRGLLLALCLNDSVKYQNICSELYNYIIREGKYAKSRIIKDTNVLKLANSLKPFDKILNRPTLLEKNSITLNVLYKAQKTNGTLPELADALFLKPGVEVKRKAL